MFSQEYGIYIDLSRISTYQSTIVFLQKTGIADIRYHYT